MDNYSDLCTPERILLGPGPSMVPPRVLKAMSHPLLGHLDPLFIELMKEVQDLLRHVFQTNNKMTLPCRGYFSHPYSIFQKQIRYLLQ